ncbi:SRPBCC family protein [Hyalangium gracile]|uniref:SRPBCC family protein n=1 Tax=Hyalangium gracile TaxID=394092 RepID=UPI001CCA720D|nr:SRPBCC domain-containing protein [Hyalangium gracile]
MSELVMDRWMPQSPEELFTAFEDPFRLRRWYGAPPGCHRLGADGNVAPGEPFRVELIDAQGARFAQLGRVLSVVPGEELVMEMAWEGGDFGPETTRVSLTFQPVDGGTRLELLQGPFSSPEALEAHRAYWNANLARLARVAAGEAVPCFEEFWEESLGFGDPLGMAAYAVLAGIREAGAPPEVISQLEETLYSHLARLPEDTAGVLGAVLRWRLKELSSP